MKRILEKLLFIAICLMSICVKAQNVEGKVIGGNDQLPLPYVNISILNTNEGTITNDDGMFELNYENAADSVEFSFLGYAVKVLSINQIKENPTIILEEEQTSLSAVTLQLEPDVATIIQKMLNNIPVNYPNNASINTGFVKEVARENGRLKRIIESGVELYVPSYLNNNEEVQVKLLNLKTNVETFDRMRPYGNFNNITRSGDILSNVKFLNDMGEKLEFEKIGRSTLEDKVVYEIKVSTKSPFKKGNTEIFYDGKLWIDKATYALVTMDITQTFYGNITNQAFRSNKIQIPFTRQLQTTRNIIRFKEIDDKWYLGDAKAVNTLLYVLDHSSNSNRRGSEKLRIEIADIFVTTDLNTNMVRPFHSTERVNINRPIYTQAGISDDKIWNKINAIKYTKEEEDFLTKYAK